MFYKGEFIDHDLAFAQVKSRQPSLLDQPLEDIQLRIDKSLCDDTHLMLRVEPLESQDDNQFRGRQGFQKAIQRKRFNENYNDYTQAAFATGGYEPKIEELKVTFTVSFIPKG